MFNKKGFTLAELIVVMAIIWMLTAAAMTIFTWAQASARDSRRVADLNTISSALDAYYIKHHFYPQPALQNSENLWWYVLGNTAEPTCNVKLKTNASWEISQDIDTTQTGYTCWWNIYKTQRIVKDFKCNFSLGGSRKSTVAYSSADMKDIKETRTLYEWDTLKQTCIEYYEQEKVKYENSLKSSGTLYTGKISNFLEGRGNKSISVSDEQFDWNNPKKTIVWWKWTLTIKSWKDSILKAEPEAPFYWFLKEQNFDPKYDSDKYRDLGLWFYPYSTYRDNAWSGSAKSIIWWTQFQIAATLEKQNEETQETQAETLIIWNYRRKVVDGKQVPGYPYSIIGGGNRNEILDWQKQWEKVPNVARPNMSTNWWIPYPVEEIQ